MALRKILLALGAVSATLGACDDPTLFDCDEVPFSIVGTSGDTVNTASGLRFIEVSAGSGAEVETCDPVTAQYTGRLASGAVFEEAGAEVVPGSGSRPAGFEQGLIGMRPGGSRRLIVPPSLGYGSTDRRNAAGEIIVPAGSTLFYDVAVIEIE